MMERLPSASEDGIEFFFYGAIRSVLDPQTGERRWSLSRPVQYTDVPIDDIGLQFDALLSQARERRKGNPAEDVDVETPEVKPENPSENLATTHEKVNSTPPASGKVTIPDNSTSSVPEKVTILYNSTPSAPEKVIVPDNSTPSVPEEVTIADSSTSSTPENVKGGHIADVAVPIGSEPLPPSKPQSSKAQSELLPPAKASPASNPGTKKKRTKKRQRNRPPRPRGGAQFQCEFPAPFPCYPGIPPPFLVDPYFAPPFFPHNFPPARGIAKRRRI